MYVCVLKGGVAHFAVSGASRTLAVEVAVSQFAELSISLIVTVTVKSGGLSSAYMCVPSTLKGPPAVPVITPGVLGDRSPQSMLAEYSAAVECGSGGAQSSTVQL